ncbi:hypothetical protein LDENG_00198460 [Lucifuga dentata]|nr:hypothetical protein LDENG_00198460 [Lucifuga dentata]
MLPLGNIIRHHGPHFHCYADDIQLYISTGTCTVLPSPHIRNLGVTFDNNLSFEKHVIHITKTAFFHLKNIARLHPLLPFSAAETLIHAFITFRLHYCNSILYGTSFKALKNFRAAEFSRTLLLGFSLTSTLVTTLASHWLPIPQQIQFKLLFITYKGSITRSHPTILHHAASVLLDQTSGHSHLGPGTGPGLTRLSLLQHPSS